MSNETFLDLNDTVYNYYLVVNTVKARWVLKKSSLNIFWKQKEAKKRVVLSSVFGSTLEFCWYVQIEIAHDVFYILLKSTSDL